MPPPADQNSTPATQNYQFDDLRLGVGHYFQIEAPSAPQPLIGHLIGFLKGTSLIVRVSSAQQRNGAQLEEGDAVRVKGFSGKVAYIFSSTVRKRRAIPFAYFHLDFPATIQGYELRSAVRVKADIPAGAEQPAAGISVSGMLSNISINGAQLQCTESLGKVGDSVAVNFTIPALDHLQQESGIKARATIRSISRLDGAQPGYSHGLQFDSLDALQTLMLQTLVQHFLLTSPGALA